MSRKRHFREIRVKLECGHVAHLNTSRFRVSEALAAILFGDAIRDGAWCHECEARCQPVEYLGVYRADDLG